MWTSLLTIGALTLGASAQNSSDPFANYTIRAPGIAASFIPYGARLVNLFVPDKNGTIRDVVLGYDNAADFRKDDLTNHTYFGPIVGRYANRIKNGTFSVDGVTSHIPENEHGGLNPLHGGTVGYDQRNWTVVSYNDSSVTFSFLDQAYEGFPGTVMNYATYSVQGSQLTSRLVSLPLDEPTPIMLANHVYWNLGAFVDEEATTVLNNTLYMPYAQRYIAVDSIEIPTGEIGAVAGTALDFTKPNTQIGSNISNANYCGDGCDGYDNAFILDRPRYAAPEATDLIMLSMESPSTGIKMDIRTNQQSLQIYSCVGQNGTVPLKAAHSAVVDKVPKYGCIVIETQQWIDGINHPEWGQDQYQIYSPETEPAVVFATYDFSVSM